MMIKGLLSFSRTEKNRKPIYHHIIDIERFVKTVCRGNEEKKEPIVKERLYIAHFVIHSFILQASM